MTIKQKQLALLSDAKHAVEGIDSITALKSFANIMQAFSNHSMNNLALIYLQNKHASLFKTDTEWQKIGHAIKPNASGFKIQKLAWDEQGMHMDYQQVFDVLDTVEGKPSSSKLDFKSTDELNSHRNLLALHKRLNKHFETLGSGITVRKHPKNKLQKQQQYAYIAPLKGLLLFTDNITNLTDKVTVLLSALLDSYSPSSLAHPKSVDHDFESAKRKLALHMLLSHLGMPTNDEKLTEVKSFLTLSKIVELVRDAHIMIKNAIKVVDGFTKEISQATTTLNSIAE